ncbi:MAG: hypothetical protein VB137_00290 [Burkholderia sp.]
MNYTEQEASKQNFKVLAGLRDLFRLLTEHGAVGGGASAQRGRGRHQQHKQAQDRPGNAHRRPTNGHRRVFFANHSQGSQNIQKAAVGDSEGFCSGYEAMCSTSTTDKPAETLAKLAAALPAGQAKRYRVKVSIVPLDE